MNHHRHAALGLPNNGLRNGAALGLRHQQAFPGGAEDVEAHNAARQLPLQQIEQDGEVDVPLRVEMVSRADIMPASWNMRCLLELVIYQTV